MPRLPKILDVESEWDATKPWMTVQERDEAVAKLVQDKGLEWTIKRLLSDWRLFSQCVFTTHDPRRTPSKLPFKLYPYQYKILECMDWCLGHGSSLGADKSRDVGFSEVTGIWLLKHWFCDDDFQALLTNRKESMIDSLREPDTLFERMRMKIRDVPDALKPALLPGFDAKKYQTFMRLINPETGSTITGEAPIRDFARQGRYSVIVYDECAFMRNLQQMIVSASESSQCHFYISTPNRRNKFWRLLEDARKNGTFPVIRVHWSEHPIKGAGLYVQQEHTLVENLRELMKKHVDNTLD